MMHKGMMHMRSAQKQRVQQYRDARCRRRCVYASSSASDWVARYKQRLAEVRRTPVLACCARAACLTAYLTTLYSTPRVLHLRRQHLRFNQALRFATCS